ncbi:MAG: 4-hydroxy-3-methylbut-2-enyl diphosphate reductase [Succinivibrionaceae bacterium]|nr:4-hydroxy-3-methylbut-2-enyl diphosphate reductase [Succinivibrionaceae bacterium]
MSFTVVLAQSRGMCAGVDRAIRTVREALRRFGPIYVLHEVVHNHHVVEDLRKEGATFVEDLNEIPAGAVTIFSAHGVGLDTIDQARARGLRVIDATCPLVERIHQKIRAAAAAGRDVVMIGHAGHQEVQGSVGQYRGPGGAVHVIFSPEDVAGLRLGPNGAMFATQTTLAYAETARTVAALRERYPEIDGPRADDTCFATQHRQAAIRDLARDCPLVLIAGSKNSSNSNRLREVAQLHGATAHLIEDETEIDPAWLLGATRVGVSAGASVPEYVVDGVLRFLRERGGLGPEIMGEAQDEPSFRLPRGLTELPTTSEESK